MRRYQLFISLLMNFRMLLRRKLVLLLLPGIPCLFIFMVHLTSSGREMIFQVGIAQTKNFVNALEVHVALVFVTIATIGFLSSFLSLSLVQQYRVINRRLVICGYHPFELMFSSLAVMLFVIAILVFCVGLSMLFFFEPAHLGPMMLGLFLTALTYGSYGMMVGSLVKGELEGTLLVILLANIDAGWLQNPLFFSEARNKFIIQLLPAYYPSQISIASAFTDLSIDKPLVASGVYALGFLGLALFISYSKMRTVSHSKQ